MDYATPLSIASHKHDLMAIQVYDKREAHLPNVGLVRVVDAETGAERWLDTGSKRVRQAHDKWWYESQARLAATMNRSKVDCAQVATDEDYTRALMDMFRNRELKR